MAYNPYIGWVNLQMVSVRHHLSLLIEETSANEKLRNRGVLESAGWHLQRAYKYYLWEVGANYQLKSPEELRNASELGKALESLGKHPGEAEELLNLETRGWIADLNRALAESARPVAVAKESQQAQGLVLVDLDRASSTLSAEQLGDWLDRFKELSSRHREVMVEY